MSGKHNNPNSGAPAETQPSGGFGGERRDSEEVGLSPQAEASEHSLSRRVSRETSKPKQPAPPQRNKRSSFYVYLAILFGAAFLMLLLAYFVQQRNNDTVLSDLRSTTAASRQELLEEIQRLEEEKQALLEEKEALGVRLSELEAELEFANTSLNYLAMTISNMWTLPPSFRPYTPAKSSWSPGTTRGRQRN